MSRQNLVWNGDFRFTGTDSWGNDVALDGTEGSGAGASPADMLPISLAACTAYDVVNILRKQRQGLRALEATIDSEQLPDAPWTFTRIDVHFVARGEVDETKACKALALAHGKYCSIAATLKGTVDMTFTITVAGD